MTTARSALHWIRASNSFVLSKVKLAIGGFSFIASVHGTVKSLTLHPRNFWVCESFALGILGVSGSAPGPLSQQVEDEGEAVASCPSYEKVPTAPLHCTWISAGPSKHQDGHWNILIIFTILILVILQPPQGHGGAPETAAPETAASETAAPETAAPLSNFS